MAILVVVDGMGDRPVASLGGETPLEAANTPHLDGLADGGATGLVDVVRPGVPPGSDTAHLALLGYDPYCDYTGRGGFEALGAGLTVEEGDVAFRGNFATVEDGVVVDRRAGRDVEEGDELASLLDGVSPDGFPGVEARVRHTTQHRCAVVLRGTGLSRAVGDADPHVEGTEVPVVEPLDGSEEARRTAEVLNALGEKFHEILEGSEINERRSTEGKPPVNRLLIRGAGVVPDLEGFYERFGVRGSFVAPVALYRGVCLSAGLKPVGLDESVVSMGDVEQVEAEAEEAAGAANSDFLFVHVKGTDNASHDGRCGDKVDVIEAVDAMVGELRAAHGGHVAVTADHSTPCSIGRHSGDPVPILVHGPEVRPDDSESFGEGSCGGGNLHRLRGRDVIYELMNLEGRVGLHGE
ncbi:MAG: 2,3-bisphosphoglycerate-independent phosphoglycerate mutase [Methanonatronarchaeales archaeon]|nr:2,3-bisphosphoglycerate-independent phosphoglycerate mutase [Methanonatronarchaeales archaeon]